MSSVESLRGAQSRVWLAAALGLALCAAFGACDRRAEIADEGDFFEPPPTNVVTDAGLVTLDASLAAPDFTACAERAETPACVGVNDFVCDLGGLLNSVAKECQVLSNCSSNGWFGVEVGSDGCASSLSVSEPNPAFEACAIARLGAARCPCKSANARVFLGFGNRGCPDAGPIPCQTAEFPCPTGQHCQDDWCVADVGSAGASGG